MKQETFFESWGMPVANGTRQPSVVMNKRGPVSTSAVIREISKNETAIRQLKEYVKYEQVITNFALKIHGKQYESIKR
jgi:hypothetical protein